MQPQPVRDWYSMTADEWPTAQVMWERPSTAYPV